MSTSLSASRLEGLIGLSGAKRVVLRIAEAESASHAILLYGAKGAGKGQLADALAVSWLSKNDDPNEQPVTAFLNGRNPDVLRVQPFGAGRMILGRQISPSRGSEGGYDGISVIEFLRTPPIMSAHKVVILEEAERLHPAAANALLKTLEEPHAYAKFILMTNSVGSILPTILSRCVAIACELPKPDERSQLNIEEEFWALAKGAPALARRYQENPAPFKSLLAFAKELRSRPLSQALAAGDQFKSIADKLDPNQAARIANTEALELLAIAISLYHPDWHQALAKITQAHRRIIGNGSAGMTFDALFTSLLSQ